MSALTLLLDQLRMAQQSVPIDAVRIFPTSFDAQEKDVLAYARALEWRWDSAHFALKHFASTGVMMRLPLFWQLESPLFYAAEEVGAFIFVNDAANMPLGAAALKSANIDVVVTHVADSTAFAAYIFEHQIPQPDWLIVHPLSDELGTLSPLLRNARVAEEVHLFPGVPLLSQCGTLIDEKKRRFHSTDGYTVTRRENGYAISGGAQDTVPLVDFPLPTPLSENETCACGRTILAF